MPSSEVSSNKLRSRHSKGMTSKRKKGRPKGKKTDQAMTTPRTQGPRDIGRIKYPVATRSSDKGNGSFLEEKRQNVPRKKAPKDSTLQRGNGVDKYAPTSLCKPIDAQYEPNKGSDVRMREGLSRRIKAIPPKMAASTGLDRDDVKADCTAVPASSVSSVDMGTRSINKGNACFREEKLQHVPRKKEPKDSKVPSGVDKYVSPSHCGKPIDAHYEPNKGSESATLHKGSDVRMREGLSRRIEAIPPNNKLILTEMAASTGLDRDDVKADRTAVPPSSVGPVAPRTVPKDPNPYCASPFTSKILEQQLESNRRRGLYDQDFKTFNINLAAFNRNELAKSIDKSLKHMQPFKVQVPCQTEASSFDMESLIQLKQVIDTIGGDSLTKAFVSSHKAKAETYIIDKLSNAASDNENLKYLHRFKSASVISDKEQTVNDNDNIFWRKACASTYRIVMDLDYDALVTNNPSFEDEILTELASTIGIHRSLLRLESSVKGSVVVFVGIAYATTLVLVMLNVLKVQAKALAYFVERKLKSKGGEPFQGLDIDDPVLADWKGKAYRATVIGKFKVKSSPRVKVIYDGKPFLFQNVETFDTASSRLHPVVGYKYKVEVNPHGNMSSEVVPVLNSYRE